MFFLFITVTCNPHWADITSALPAGGKWKDHPDVVSRAFMLRLKSIVNDFKVGCIFGALKAYVYRIEWQARGLPHAHMLLILEHKIMSTRQIDSIVSAEVPDPVGSPVLHATVVSTSIDVQDVTSRVNAPHQHDNVRNVH